ncbi:Polyamine transporter 3 [Talaromyces islandicus]|uniref:Polyamine transporter 3 n=1 Tax=Talaromyces islandicus TaxID=28573 RepID=A0A0U1LRI7_TALIS|nr:Polyamine transporter 3 [Talaromyces islandicus]
MDDVLPRRDRNGLLLLPQASQDPRDPLNWKPWLKIMVLAEISLLSFLSLLSASLITPNFQPLSRYLDRPLGQTVYVTSMFLLSCALSSIFWNPISNVYGRRPVYIITVLGGLLMSVASGKATSYGPLLAFRCLNGFFGGVPGGLGNAVVTDLFFTHERGLYMGIYTVMYITGGHIAPIIGGYIADDISWRWCFYIPAIITAVVWVIYVLTVPETLYPRASQTQQPQRRTWTQNMTLQGSSNSTGRLRLIDFFRPFQMLIYPSVLLPSLYYAVAFAHGSILFIISSAQLFAADYGYEAKRTGLLLGIPITVGSVLGELLSGGFSDWISERRSLARGKRKPEDRFLAIIPSFFLTPLGIIIEGLCLEHRTHFMGVAMGIATASFGLQVATTVVYTYTSECYKPQTPEIGTILNFARNMVSFGMSFYALPFVVAVGVQDAWIVLALTIVVFFFPLVPLYLWGAKWRERLGNPAFNSDL